MSAPIPQRWQDLKLLAEEELHRYAANPWPSHLLCAVEDIAALQAQNQTLETALKFYADRDNHEMDGGKRARAALAATEPKE